MHLTVSVTQINGPKYSWNYSNEMAKKEEVNKVPLAVEKGFSFCFGREVKRNIPLRLLSNDF
jgi:hypothetical protein